MLPIDINIVIYLHRISVVPITLWIPSPALQISQLSEWFYQSIWCGHSTLAPLVIHPPMAGQLSMAFSTPIDIYIYIYILCVCPHNHLNASRTTFNGPPLIKLQLRVELRKEYPPQSSNKAFLCCVIAPCGCITDHQQQWQHSTPLH